MNYDQFHRTRLLFGEDGLNRLWHSHVAVVGCGAVGSFAIEALARAGIGHLTLVDGDTVETTNINRQLCALHSTLNIPKTVVLQNRIHDICPDTTVHTKTIFVNDDNCDNLFDIRPDFAIDAIDRISGKIPLILSLQRNKIPFISSMGAARKTDWTKIKMAPLNQTQVCPLAAKLRKLLKDQIADLSFPCVFSTEQPADAQSANRQMGSIVTLTGMFGLILAHEVIQRILK